jgi:hypothetical protein
MTLNEIARYIIEIIQHLFVQILCIYYKVEISLLNT